MRVIAFVFFAACQPFCAAGWANEITPQKRYLMSAGEVHNSRSTPLILDVRDRESFEAAHIPESQWANAPAWTQRSSEKLPSESMDFWKAELGQLGVQLDQPTVLVGGDSPTGVARIWWLLKAVGLADVRILDGGFSAWQQARLPTTKDITSRTATKLELQFQPGRLAVLTDMLPSARERSQCSVLDNRSDAEYAGSRQLGPRGGHIPGAIHLEWKQFVDADGKYLSVEDIRRKLQSAGVDIKAPLVTHCQTGGRSSVAAFALEMAGATQVRNYYRGWSEYSAATQAPVEK